MSAVPPIGRFFSFSIYQILTLANALYRPVHAPLPAVKPLLSVILIPPVILQNASDFLLLKMMLKMHTYHVGKTARIHLKLRSVARRYVLYNKSTVCPSWETCIRID